MRDTVANAGFQLDTTPVDTLMGGPLSMGLGVAEDLENDHYDRPEPIGEIPEGFQEWDPEQELLENRLATDDASLCILAGVDDYTE